MTAASADVHCTCLPVQADVKVQNMVTLGASALNNNSAAYASYAILVDQAIGQQVTYSHHGTRKGHRRACMFAAIAVGQLSARYSKSNGCFWAFD